MLTANTLLQYGSGKLLAFKQLDPYVTNTFNAGSLTGPGLAGSLGCRNFTFGKGRGFLGTNLSTGNPAVQAVSLQDGLVFGEHLG